MNPGSPHLPALPASISVCLSPRACPSPPSLGLAPLVEGTSYLALRPRRQDSLPPWLSGHGAQLWVAEGHVMISSPKPQAVPASVKCDRSWAPAGPSKQAIFMKWNDYPSYIKITPPQEGPRVRAAAQRDIHGLAEGSWWRLGPRPRGKRGWGAWGSGVTDRRAVRGGRDGGYGGRPGFPECNPGHGCFRPGSQCHGLHCLNVPPGMQAGTLVGRWG